MIDSTVTSALNGITAAQTSAAANADRIARFAGNTADMAQSVIGLIVAKQQLEASVAAIKTDDQVQQSLLNILA
jgi:hypothetical protein